MKLTKQIYLYSTALASLIFSTAVFLQASNSTPKHTIKEVMQAIHKGEDNIGKRVAAGKASKEDIDQMLEYYMSLPMSEPPRGERSSWTEKSTALLNSARLVKENKPGAIEAYKTAMNCKACHNVHKPEQK